MNTDGGNDMYDCSLPLFIKEVSGKYPSYWIVRYGNENDPGHQSGVVSHRFSYAVLSTSICSRLVSRRRNHVASGSRGSRAWQIKVLQNGAQESRARRCLPRQSEPL